MVDGGRGSLLKDGGRRTEVAGDCSNQVCRRRRKREKGQRSEEGWKFLWLGAEGQRWVNVWDAPTDQPQCSSGHEKIHQGGAIQNSAAAPPPRDQCA